MDLLDRAARLFLNGHTAEANAAVNKAVKLDPSYFDLLSRQTADLSSDIQSAIAANTLERVEASDHYTEDHVRIYWQSAKTEFETLSPTENANALVYRVYLNEIGRAVSELKPDTVLDFGCACGLPLHKIALANPQTNVIGVDRQEVLKTINDEHFKSANLHFVAGNVLDAMPSLDGSNKMLVHVRTGIMVYPAFLERLYKLAAANGFRYVALYEIASLSCVSWTFRDQGSGFQSEAHRSTMFIHDYASALKRAGFDPTEIKPMPHGYALKKNNMLPGDTYVFILARLSP